MQKLLISSSSSGSGTAGRARAGVAAGGRLITGTDCDCGDCCIGLGVGGSLTETTFGLTLHPHQPLCLSCSNQALRVRHPLSTPNTFYVLHSPYDYFIDLYSKANMLG
uniref:Uncharacterized protein n=1 Tax=Glossina austeni TaxID=7395 RepID=A0A1A9VTV3_GLOAU